MYKIAISGMANAGKNTLGKIIVKQLRAKDLANRASYLAFADPIKKMALVMFPALPKKWLFGPSKLRNKIIDGAFSDGKPLTVRQLLLDLGTKVGRGYKDNIWLDNFDERLYAKSKLSEIIIVSDERFKNEFDHLKSKGFYQIRLYRKTNEPAINHISETGQEMIKDSEFDCVIHNDKTLNYIKEVVSKDVLPFLINN